MPTPRVEVKGQNASNLNLYSIPVRTNRARQGVYAMIERPPVKVLERDQGSPILSAIYSFRNRAYVVIQ